MKTFPPSRPRDAANADTPETSLRSALRRLALDAQWLQMGPDEVARLLAEEMGRRAPDSKKENLP